MADELNVPTHRWYEPRNNIALPPNAVSAKYILANGVALIDAWINSRPWGPYSVDGFVPPLALDFVADYYQTDSTATTFDSALTFVRASSATMVDSTGTLVTVASGVPRIGHHVYNGSAWVNEGLLVESEARTNLLLNSGTLATQSVTVAAVANTLSFTGTGTVTLSGVSTAGPLVGTGTGENNRVSLTFTPTAGTLTLTVSGTVTNAQLEAGSTPSSYIPTAGATVTRAAETLVIPSANLPWPSPQYVTGTELVTNGDFSAGSTGWAVVGTGWSIASGLLSGSGVPANDYGPYQQATSVVAGVAYEATYTITVTAGGVAARVGNTQSSTYTSSGTYTQPFVATSTGVTVFQVRAGGSGFTGTIDNISVKEINPLAVSIAMDGRATGNTLTTARWYNSSTAYITQSIGATSLSFAQYGGGALDTVTGGSFSPGINVPFNIAARHGSTFVNGAVDGVALTADLTPVALPNLSASNLQLGYAFMGTIGSFRIWADDLGDTGIAEASA